MVHQATGGPFGLHDVSRTLSNLDTLFKGPIKGPKLYNNFLCMVQKHELPTNVI